MDVGIGCRGDEAAWDRTSLETSSNGRTWYDTVAASGIWEIAAGTAVGVEMLGGERRRGGEEIIRVIIGD